jgi:hypothetical protein
MSDDERQAVYDEWVAAQPDVTTEGVRGAASQGQDALSAYDTRRDRVEADNPRVADYVQYQKYVFGLADEGGIRQYREDLLAIGDTEFSAAHEDKKQRLMDQGYAGEELEAELDDWMTKDEAFAAIMGWQWKDRRTPGPAVYSARDEAPWRQEKESSESSGASEFKESDSGIRGPVEDVGNFVENEARRLGRERYSYRRPKKKSGDSGQYPSMMLDFLLK